MRQLASILLLAFVLPATAADTWRWKDANGVVHYSDRPVPGAERMNLGPAAAPAAGPAAPAPRGGPGQRPQTTAPNPYTSCIVVAPAQDETFNNVNTVLASLQVTPSLQAEHRLQVMLDGAAHAAWPDRAMSSALVNINRGTHTLSVQVLDAEGRTLCTGPAATFHVRQASIFAPARQPARRP